MTLAAARTAIVAKLNTVSNIGRVHSYPRYIDDPGQLITHYVSGAHAQIRGWHVERVSTQELSPSLGRFIVRDTWRITGFMAVDDAAATWTTFDDLVEAVRDAFRTDEDLGGAISTTVVNDVAGVQVDEEGAILFAGVLCHSAKLRLVTEYYR